MGEVPLGRVLVFCFFKVRSAGGGVWVQLGWLWAVSEGGLRLETLTKPSFEIELRLPSSCHRFMREVASETVASGDPHPPRLTV